MLLRNKVLLVLPIHVTSRPATPAKMPDGAATPPERVEPTTHVHLTFHGPNRLGPHARTARPDQLPPPHRAGDLAMSDELAECPECGTVAVSERIGPEGCDACLRRW